MSPRRVQRRRVRGWTAPLDAQGRRPVYVGRGSLYGNPFRIVREAGAWVVRVEAAEGVRGFTHGAYPTELEARQAAVDGFRADLRTPGGSDLADFVVRRLHGRDLMCWCKTTDPCHGDVWLDLSNPNPIKET